MLISILEAIYVVYMLRYFKTTQSFIVSDMPNIINTNMFSYLKHNEYNTNSPEHHICKFGRDASLIIGIYLLIRAYSIHQYKSWNWKINIIIVSIIFLISLINLNAVIYLFPFYVTEIYLISQSI